MPSLGEYMQGAQGVYGVEIDEEIKRMQDYKDRQNLLFLGMEGPELEELQQRLQQLSPEKRQILLKNVFADYALGYKVTVDSLSRIIAKVFGKPKAG